MITGRLITPMYDSTRRTTELVLFSGNPNQIDTISVLSLNFSLSSKFLSH
jgi:hypothetical protein